MAAIRTGTALIGFGFTIVQFFARFAGMDQVRSAVFPSAPRYLGLALIGAGVASLSVFLLMYRSTLAHLWGEDYRAVAGLQQPSKQTTPSSWVAIIVILVGIFTFAAVLFRAI